MKKLLSVLLALALIVAAPAVSLGEDGSSMTTTVDYEARTERLDAIGISIQIPSDWLVIHEEGDTNWYFYDPSMDYAVNIYYYADTTYDSMSGYYASVCEEGDGSSYTNGAYWTINGRPFFVCEGSGSQLFSVCATPDGNCVDFRFSYPDGTEQPWSAYYSLIGSVAELSADSGDGSGHVVDLDALLNEGAQTNEPAAAPEGTEAPDDAARHLLTEEELNQLAAERP